MTISDPIRSRRVPSPRRLTAGLFLVAATLLTGACDNPAEVRTITSITVTPATVALAINGTQQYVAVGRDANDRVVAFTPTWTVAATGGTVSSTGLFTAGTLAGTFSNTVSASNGTVTGTATVTVNAGALANIVVSPSSGTMIISGAQQFTAVGRDAYNNVVVITPVWSVVASGGTISVGGLFTAGATAGTFTNTVRAASGAISGTASVTIGVGALASVTITPRPVVLPMAGAQQFTAVGRDAGNNVVAITPVWSVIAGGGTISANGLFTAGGAAGTFINTVRATSGAVSGNATVNVTSGVGRLPVNLGTAGNYVILAKSAISNVPTSAITGDLGISPAAATFITGFALTLPAASPFATSAQVTGNIYAPGYAAPTATNLTTAIGDMETAYTDAAGRVTPDFTELASGDIGGLTLPAGLYKWSNTVTIPSNVTLNGGATDVWIFQIAGGITQASATSVTLTGGALAKNVFWQVFGVVSIGTGAHMEGIVLSQTSITLATGASANGRLLAQTAVSLAGNIVVRPAP